MAKSKVSSKDTQRQEPAEFMNHIRNEVKKLESCNFEDFKSNMIAVIEQMYQVMLMTAEHNAKERKELAEFAIDQAEKVKAVNDKDFKIAERNFTKVDKGLDDFEHRVSKAEAGAIFCLMRVSAMASRLYEKGIIPLGDLTNPERELKLVPKKVMKCIAEIFGVSQRSIKAMVMEVSKNAA